VYFAIDKISIYNSGWHILHVIIYLETIQGRLILVITLSFRLHYTILNPMVKTIITGLLFLFPLMGFSQMVLLPVNDDNSELFVRIDKDQLKDLDSLYVVESGCGRDFINGREYRGYYFRSEHKPVLYYGRERTASLVYKGRTYTNLALQYDTYLGQVFYMTYHDWDASQVALNSDNVSRFELCFDNDTLTFCYISKELWPSFNLGNGFYEVVYDGKCKYIVRHGSSHIIRNGMDEYDYKPVGYVMVNGGFVRISSRKQFVNLFGEKSKEIKQFVEDNRIRISKADKRQVTGILRFYENL